MSIILLIMSLILLCPCNIFLVKRIHSLCRNCNNNGFILASADDRYVPIYAYVPEGNFEKEGIPESGFKDILDNLIYKVTNPEDSTHYKVYIAQIMKYPDEWYE